MRPLTAAAGLNVALHVVGLGLAYVGMRPGSPVVPLDDRMAYLAARPALWMLGWGCWMLCALALVALMAALRSHAASRDLTSLALMLTVSGAAVDILCDVGQMAVLPDAAAWKPAQPAQFVAWERWLGAGGAVVANGFYSIAVVIVTWPMRRQVPGYVLGLAVATFGAGMLMVAAGITGDARLLEASVAPTIFSFLAWTVAVAVTAK
jgi:hypothetical protein